MGDDLPPPPSTKATGVKKAAWLAKHYLRQTYLQIRAHKASFALGVCACVVVVIVVADLLTVIGNAPIIYLRVAELSASEVDVRLTPAAGDAAAALNFSRLTDVLLAADADASTLRFAYAAPRFVLKDALVYRCSPANRSNAVEPGARWMYGVNGDDFEALCGAGDASTSTDVLVADSRREARMLLGRTWALPPLEYGRRLAHVSGPLAEKLGVGVGDTFVVALAPGSAVWFLWRAAHVNSSHPRWGSEPVFVPLVVAGIYSDAGGRVESSLEKGVIVEFDDFAGLLATSIDPDDTVARAWFAAANLSEWAQEILVNLPPPRSVEYINSNMDTIRKTITQFAAEVVYRSGFNNLDVDLPVMHTLYPFRWVALFLSLIINLSIIVLLFLCVVLIYSLLMINVETRTFEVGVFRMIGSSRKGLVALLLTQALAYAVPSWVIGLALAQVVVVAVFKAIESVANIPIPYLLTGAGIGVATALGFAVPMVASILPIRNALKQNLSMSLDTRRSKAAAVKIKVERSENAKISWPVMWTGIFMSIFGLGVYIIFPTGLLTFNFGLLLNLFFVLLLLMLVGLVMLSLNLENLIYRGLAFAFFFWDKLAIRKIIVKNLIAHKLRNRKTTIMYSVSLSFIIFLYVAYEMQIVSFQFETRQSLGADLGISIEGVKSDGSPYTISHSIVPQLEAFARSSPLVRGFAWSTIELGLITGSSYTASNIGRIYDNQLEVYGVSPNFNDVVFDGFMRFGARSIALDLPENVSLSQQLYSRQGSKGMVLGTYLMTSLGIEPESHFLFNEYLESGTSDSGFSFGAAMDFSSASAAPPLRKEAFAFMTTATGFSFSKFPTATTQDAVVSFPHYISLSRGKVAAADDLPLGRFFVRLVDGVSDEDYNKLRQELIDIAATQEAGSPDVWDLRQQISSMDVATQITSYFFLFTTIIAMVTSFFSLSSSMLANVYEQTKEIGVLRALGLTKSVVRRLYVYEAYIIVFGSSLVGVIIGTIIGWTMTLQRQLFTQLPLSFVFPWQILLIVFGLSVVFAAISSWGPIADLMKKPIVQIMRTLT